MAEKEILKRVTSYRRQKRTEWCRGKVADQTLGISTTRAPRFNLLRIEKELSMAHLRLSRTFIVGKCIRHYDRPCTLFYCDPPYRGTEGYGVDFPLENYTHMADLARSIQGKMIISMNDIPEMHEVFDGLTISSVDICCNLNVAGQTTARKELIICNF